LRKFDKDCKEAFKMLVEALNNKDKYIRTKAVDMLSKQDFKDNPEILEALLKSLNDQEAEIRKKILENFGKQDLKENKEVVNALVNCPVEMFE